MFSERENVNAPNARENQGRAHCKTDDLAGITGGVVIHQHRNVHRLIPEPRLQNFGNTKKQQHFKAAEQL
jgi:hypothetical protein